MISMVVINRINNNTNLFALCLQHTSLSPDGKLLVIVGDNPEGILVDSQTGKVGVFCLPMFRVND